MWSPRGVVSLCRLCITRTAPSKRGLSSKSYYDSQSGTHITIPGSEGMRIHDSHLKFRTRGAENVDDAAIISHLRAAKAAGATSASLPIVAGEADFREYLHQSIAYLKRNSSQVPKVSVQLLSRQHAEIVAKLVCSDPAASAVFEVESDIFFPRDASIADMQIVKSAQQLAELRVVSRANVFVCADAFLGFKDAPLSLSVIQAGDLVAGLCESKVDVINLVLYSRVDGTTPTAGSGDFCDFIREVLEEALNLDVVGDPLLERLSLLVPSTAQQPDLSECLNTALSLGLTRLSVAGIKSDYSCPAVNQFQRSSTTYFTFGAALTEPSFFAVITPHLLKKGL
ncbi:hypothetical protein B484DRAFT_456829 [Ochromonadaceae sp. CCMP2298]|nr:hypothetical protein B484DRAFT_456829 [Ochromonadaceae sp. CCMP2298]|mmetsp:Transcript_13248/g.29299  ORF Transcript_13248/g.29299 Transcript_13248/m.29299 type:complete len:340 (+) Transcript_13248:70-1089(+)